MQQEPKLTAVLSRDEKMLESARSGGDVYSAVAAIAFNTTYENCLEFFPEGTPIRHGADGKWEMCDSSIAEKLADGKTDTNYSGKNRRTQAKSIVLGKLMFQTLGLIYYNRNKCPCIKWFMQKSKWTLLLKGVQIILC